MNFKMLNVFWFFIFLYIGLIHGYCKYKGCDFGGKSYLPGVEVEFGCFFFNCTKEYIWEFTGINGNCENCSLKNDPHFVTFDGYRYDFHGHCNYSISQPFGNCDSESSYNPPYGIFGDFLQCQSPWLTATCLDKTTYKISNSLLISIKHDNLPALEGGIIPTTEPIVYYDCSNFWDMAIIWKDIDGCVYIVGTYYSIHACKTSMVIFTIPKQINQIGGLCGYYSGIIERDEFRRRDCTYEILTNYYPFGENWRTIEQTDKECIEKPPLTEPPRYDCDEHLAKEICYVIMREANKICPGGFNQEDFSKVLDDCIQDCCLTGNENCRKWGEVGQDFLCTLTKLNNLITFRNEAKK